MALFGKSRDISLFHSLNKELLNNLIQTEIAYYKFALEQSVANVYGESMGKNYYEPLKIACLINKDDQSWSSDDFGSDINQSLTFSFLKDELKTINLFPNVGDIVLFRNNFFEIDTKNENQLIMGRDSEYALSTETAEHGTSFSIIVTAHQSRVEKLNLVPLRGGKYPTTTKVEGEISNKTP
ncbi:hypothetical protein OAU28_01470 [Flavobacteriales bacterium]|jgi:hypothetical protein|nr:hypothetical protein [Flavobacteriales bacterium]